jgi:hypothetical protein
MKNRRSLLLGATALMLFIALLIVWRISLIARTAHIEVGRPVYLAKDVESFRLLASHRPLFGREFQLAAAPFIRKARIVLLRPGVGIRTIDTRILTERGLVRPFPNGGSEVVACEVLVLNGEYAGAVGWVLASDFRYDVGLP